MADQAQIDLEPAESHPAQTGAGTMNRMQKNILAVAAAMSTLMLVYVPTQLYVAEQTATTFNTLHPRA